MKANMITKKIVKPKQTVQEKMYDNRYQIAYAVDSLNDLLPMLHILQVYIDSEKFSKYSLECFINGMKTILIHGTCEIENWLEIQHEVTDAKKSTDSNN
jgi:hypothetical protein